MATNIIKEKFKIENRKSITINLKDYCHFAEKGDCIELTEWVNGEGFNIITSYTNIDKKSDQLNIQLTDGEILSLIKAYAFIRYGTTLNFEEY